MNARLTRASIVIALALWILAVRYQQFRSTPGMDFEHYYVAAQMVRTAAGTQLYSPSAQYAFQSQYLHHSGTLFNYPAAAALLYWPTTFLDLNHGYLLWSAISMAVIIISLFLFNRRFSISRQFCWFVLLCLGFLPLHASLVTGQADAFLLLAYVLTLVSLDSECPVLAGFALAFGLIKFHLILPFVFVMIVRKQMRFLLGFSAGTVMMALLSLAVSGTAVFTAYPKLLLSMQSLPNGGFHPDLMPNIRGLIFLSTRHEAPMWLLMIIAFATLACIGRRWTTLEDGFSAAVVATLFVTYHVYPADLLLLIIPLAFASKSPAWPTIKLAAFALLAVPVVPYMAVNGRYSAVLALPMVLLLWIFITPTWAWRWSHSEV